MSDLQQFIEAMTPAERRGALAVLDRISRPMTAREIEGALHRAGVSRNRAIIVSGALKELRIVGLLSQEKSLGADGFKPRRQRLQS
jgi:hypothetical protein